MLRSVVSPRLIPAAFGAAPRGDRLERVRRSAQFTDGALRNSVPTTPKVPGGRSRAMYLQLTGQRQRQPGFIVPVRRLSAADFAWHPSSRIRLTWLGHATVLAELDGRRVLFDPVWSSRCSPVPFAGPRRCHPIPIPLDELPRIDVVVISHDHYDHLDMPTVSALAGLTDAPFAVPLGVGAHLERWGIPAGRIIECDWHETGRAAGLALTATPARHHCSRSLRSSRTTLWSSWVIEGPTQRVFHCGDSGYFPGLADIGKDYGPFDATMIPVGAYHELWPDVHLTPEEAVQAHEDLRGAAMLPIHWATYPIAPQPWAEPIERTVAAARGRDIRLLTPRPGEPVDPTATELGSVPWWRPTRTDETDHLPRILTASNRHQ